MPTDTVQPGPGGFYAPTLYAGWWLFVGLGLLALVATWYGWVFWSTRPPRGPKSARAGQHPTADLRSRYQAEIDIIVGLVARGELSARRGQQDISSVVRRFVEATSGIKAPHMTLTELRDGGEQLSPVAAVVEQLYPGEFGPAESDTVDGAAHVAKEVIARWT